MSKVFGTSGRDLLQIIFGITVLALGVTWFSAPLGLVAGGITGLSIVILELSEKLLGFPIPLYVTNIVLNVPLFIIAIRQRGFPFAQRSLFAVSWLSVALWYCGLLPNYFHVGEDLFLGVVFGGLLFGTGIGIVLRASASTGGTDMLASIIKFKNPGFPIVRLIQVIDGVIILSGFFVFGPHKGMYAIVMMIISSYMINTWLSGMHFAKAAFILSEKSEEISREIIQRLGRGNTGIKAKGMYTKEDREMLYVVVYPKQVGELRNIVKEVDANAFITIANVTEVLGEGFSQDYNSLGL